MDRHAWGWHRAKVFGVTITTLRQDLYYRVRSGKVRRINACERSAQNRAPTRRISGSTRSWITARGNARCQTMWTISYGIHLGSISAEVEQRDMRQVLVVSPRGAIASNTLKLA